MVEGLSGLAGLCAGGEVVEWAPSRRELVLAGGAVATLYSGANPEGLRGPAASFRVVRRTGQVAASGGGVGHARAGACAAATRPRALVTTTPRGAVRGVEADPGGGDTVLTRGSSRDNPHLPAAFVRAVEAAYGGHADGARGARRGAARRCARGRCGRWRWSRRGCRGAGAGGGAAGAGGGRGRSAGERGGDVRDRGVRARWRGGRVGAGGSLGGRAVARGLGAPGGRGGRGARGGPGGGRGQPGRGYGGLGAARGGDRAAGDAGDARSKSKAARAEPVAGLFEAGKARFGGRFAELEAELGGLVPAGYEGPGESPDRADAMVWALWALLLAGEGSRGCGWFEGARGSRSPSPPRRCAACPSPPEGGEAGPLASGCQPRASIMTVNRWVLGK